MAPFYPALQPGTPQHILDAARALAASISTTPEAIYPPTGQRGLFQIIEHARQPLTVREEIPFDDAALAVPIRRPVRTLIELSEGQRPSLGFLPGE
jgi:hypothetical protein